MFRSALVATLTGTLGEMGAASWQWSGRSMDERKAAGECLSTLAEQSFSFSRLEQYSLPSAAVSQEESHVNVATLISVKYGTGFKVVSNSRSKEQYVLTQCDLGQPDDAAVDAVEALPDPNTWVRKNFKIPLEKAVVVETTSLSFVEALGVEDRMVAVSQYGVAPCWQQARLECGAGLNSDLAVKTQQYEAADGVFMDCTTTGCPVEVANAIAFNPTADPGNLHGAEYIKVMAAFFNLEAKANTVFAAKLRDYTAMAAVPNRPVVAWINFAAGSQWNGNEDQFILSLADYKQQLVQDAGFGNKNAVAMQQQLPQLREDTTVAAGTKYTLYVSDFADKAAASAAFFGAMDDVYAVIDEIYASVPASYTITDFYTNYGLTGSSSLPFIADSKVLRVDGTTSSDNWLDWFESRIGNPDRALKGLRRSLTGNTTFERKYFRNIATGEAPEVLTAQMCSSSLPVCSPTNGDPIYPHTITYLTPEASAPRAKLFSALILHLTMALSMSVNF